MLEIRSNLGRMLFACILLCASAPVEASTQGPGIELQWSKPAADQRRSVTAVLAGGSGTNEAVTFSWSRLLNNVESTTLSVGTAGATNDWISVFPDPVVARTFAIKRGGSVWGWGDLSIFGLPADVRIPVRLRPNGDWIEVAALGTGYQSRLFLLKSDGTLWSGLAQSADLQKLNLPKLETIASGLRSSSMKLEVWGLSVGGQLGMIWALSDGGLYPDPEGFKGFRPVHSAYGDFPGDGDAIPQPRWASVLFGGKAALRRDGSLWVNEQSTLEFHSFFTQKSPTERWSKVVDCGSENWIAALSEDGFVWAWSGDASYSSLFGGASEFDRRNGLRLDSSGGFRDLAVLSVPGGPVALLAVDAQGRVCSLSAHGAKVFFEVPVPCKKVFASDSLGRVFALGEDGTLWAVRLQSLYSDGQRVSQVGIDPGWGLREPVYGIPLAYTFSDAEPADDFVIELTAEQSGVTRRGASAPGMLNSELAEPKRLAAAAALSFSVPLNPIPGAVYHWVRDGMSLGAAADPSSGLLSFQKTNATSADSGLYWAEARVANGTSFLTVARSEVTPLVVEGSVLKKAHQDLMAPAPNYATILGALAAVSDSSPDAAAAKVLHSLVNIYSAGFDSATAGALNLLGYDPAGDPHGIGKAPRFRGQYLATANASEIKKWLVNVLYPRLSTAELNLSKITSRSVVGVLDLKEFGASNPELVAYDYGDIQMLRAGGLLMMAFIKWLETLKTDVPPSAEQFQKDYLAGKLSLEYLLTQCPEFMNAASSPQAAQSSLEAHFQGALNAYLNFSDFVNPVSVTGSQTRVRGFHALFALESDEDFAQERILRGNCERMKASLLAANPASSILLRNPLDLEQASFEAVAISPVAFVRHPGGWRADFPAFRRNRYQIGSIRSGTFFELAPDLSPADLAEAEESLLEQEESWNRSLGSGREYQPVVKCVSIASGTAAATLLQTDASISIVSNGWALVSGSVTSGTLASAPEIRWVELQSLQSGGTHTAVAAVTERPRTSGVNVRVFDWVARIPAIPATASTLTASAMTSEGRFGASPSSKVQFTSQPSSAQPKLTMPSSKSGGRFVIITGTSQVRYTINGEATKDAYAVDEWLTVSVGDDFIAGIKRDGSLWTWGSGRGLGGETQQFRSEPARVGDLSDWLQVSCSGTAAVGLTKSGSLFAWGDLRTDYGSQTTDQPARIANEGSVVWSGILPLGGDPASVDGSSYRFLAFDGSKWRRIVFRNDSPPAVDFEAWNATWLADGGDWRSGVFTKKSAEFIGVKRDGTLWNSPANSSQSMSPQYGSDWAFVNASETSLGSYDPYWGYYQQYHLPFFVALKKDGSLWAWGWNPDVFPFQRDASAFDAQYRKQWYPVEIGRLAGACSVHVFGGKIMLLTVDGNLFRFSNGEFIRGIHGDLLGDYTDSLLQEYTTDSRLSDIVSLACGGAGWTAVDRDGVLWAWSEPPQRGIPSGLLGGFGWRASRASFQSVAQVGGVFPDFLGHFQSKGGTLKTLGIPVSLRPEVRVIENNVGIHEFVLVDGGSLPSDSGLNGSNVDSFFIAKTEVSWGEWQRVRAWASMNGYDLAGIGSGRGDNYPVTDVNWYDVVKWCNARSEEAGKEPVYKIGLGVYRTGQHVPTVEEPANGYRLPTEAEWEYAARGGRLTRAYVYSGSNSVEEVAWTNLLTNAQPVGLKLPNELGIHDMSGNVWEWCFSRPNWDPFGQSRVIRGGGWYGDGGCEVANRNLLTGDPWYRINQAGFRLAANSRDYSNSFDGDASALTVTLMNGSTLSTQTFLHPKQNVLPVPTAVRAGEALVVSGSLSFGTLSATMQMKKNGVVVSNGTTFTKAAATTADTGVYWFEGTALGSTVRGISAPVVVDSVNVGNARNELAKRTVAGNLSAAAFLDAAIAASDKDGGAQLLKAILRIYDLSNDPSTASVLSSLGFSGSADLLRSTLQWNESGFPVGAVSASAKNWLIEKLYPALDAAELGLAKIQDQNFLTFLNQSLFSAVSNSAVRIFVDYGDLQFLRACLRTGMAWVKWLQAQDTDVNLRELQAEQRNGRLSIQRILESYPRLLADSGPSASAARDAFETNLVAALQAYQRFSDFVNPSSGSANSARWDASTWQWLSDYDSERFTDNAVGLVVLDDFDGDRIEEARFRASVDRALMSINAASLAEGFRVFELEDGEPLSISPRAFVKHPAGWRADLPKFTKNAYRKNTLSSAAFTSMLSSFTLAELAETEEWLAGQAPFLDRVLGTRLDDAAPEWAANGVPARVSSEDGWATMEGLVRDASGVESVEVTVLNGVSRETVLAELQDLGRDESGARMVRWIAAWPASYFRTGSVTFEIVVRDVYGARQDAPRLLSLPVVRLVDLNLSKTGNGRLLCSPAPDPQGRLPLGTRVVLRMYPDRGHILRRVELAIDGESQPRPLVRSSMLFLQLRGDTDVDVAFEPNPYELIGGRNRTVGGLLDARAPFTELQTEHEVYAEGVFPLTSIQVSLTASGAVSGRLVMGRDVTPFTGRFDADGIIRIPVQISQLVWSRIMGRTPEYQPSTRLMSSELWLSIDTTEGIGKPRLHAQISGASGWTLEGFLKPLASEDYYGPPIFSGFFDRTSGLRRGGANWNPSMGSTGTLNAPVNTKGSAGGYYQLSILRTGFVQLTGVLPTGEKLTASSRLVSNIGIAQDPLQGSVKFAGVELVAPTARQGALGLVLNVGAPLANPTAENSISGWSRWESWTSRNRSPIPLTLTAQQTGGPSTDYVFARQWGLRGAHYVHSSTAIPAAFRDAWGGPSDGLTLKWNSSSPGVTDVMRVSASWGFPATGFEAAGFPPAPGGVSEFSNLEFSLTVRTGQFSGSVSPGSQGGLSPGKFKGQIFHRALQDSDHGTIWGSGVSETGDRVLLK